LRQVTGDSGRGKRALAVAALGLAASLPAKAVFNDWFEIWVAENVTKDTNVFRLSDNLDASSLGVTRGRGDSIFSTYIGATANIPVHQQRFEAAYTWNRARYRTYDQLDYDGHSARAAWTYNFENKVTGVLSYDETETLASFSTFQVPLKDLVTVRAFRGTSVWLATPRYRVDGAAAAVRTEHSNPVRSVEDIESAMGSLGLSYVTPQDNLVGAAVRYERGRSPHDDSLSLGSPIGSPIVVVPTFVNNRYEQWALGLTTTYIPTPHSRFEGRVEYLRRQYDVDNQRNYSGPAGRFLYRWTPTVKLTVDVAASREPGPPEDIQTSFVLITGGYVRPKWQITEKTYLQGNAEYNVWDYRGDTLVGGSFTHRQRLIGASLQWKPWERIWLNVGANREVRTSTLLFGDYETTVYFVEGRVGF
jgi:hypothetical protein